MPTVEPFNRRMIEKFLKSVGWNYMTTRNGDFVVQFTRDEDSGREMTFLFVADGDEKEILLIRIHADLNVPKKDWGRALMTCNTWNRNYRWPTAYLGVEDPDRDKTGEIVLERQIDLSSGVHQELLNDFVFRTFAAGSKFWEWAHQEQGF
jgi:hypothetical protein